jgi:LysR family transcriptional regulator, cyn operon transcriptional activator
MLLRHIRYFLAVAEHGNFTRAAEALHVSQPTLSQQIRQLEEMLRTQLFDRSGRTVQLTDSGAAWLRYARMALQDLDAGGRAIHDVETLTRGSLRLAMTPTFTAYFIGPLVRRFSELYPGISLHIREMTQDRMETMLGADELDLGIAFDEAHAPDIECQALFTERLTLVVGRGHPHAEAGRALTSREFEQETLVLLTADFATRRHIDHYCEQNDVKPRIAIEANSISAIVEIVRGGQLATVLPDAIAQSNADLSPVELEPALPTRTAALLQRKGAYRSAASRALVALAMQPR